MPSRKCFLARPSQRMYSLLAAEQVTSPSCDTWLVVSVPLLLHPVASQKVHQSNQLFNPSLRLLLTGRHKFDHNDLAICGYQLGRINQQRFSGKR